MVTCMCFPTAAAPCWNFSIGSVSVTRYTYKRLSVGRFHPKIFLRDGVGFRSMRWGELVLPMEGISPGMTRRKGYQTGLSREKVEKESPYLKTVA